MPEFYDRISKNPAVRENLQFIFAYNLTGPEFIGYSKPGTLRGEHKWQIMKYIYDGSNVIEGIFANNNPDFIHKWDDRGSLNYEIS